MRILLLIGAAVRLIAAEPFPIRTYIANLDASSVTLAWGRADGVGRNTIGRGAASAGRAVIRIDQREIATTASWLRVENLRPDSLYGYSVSIDGAEVARGEVRTWPVRAKALRFFVIGDFGNGSPEQIALAKRMEQERLRLDASGNPVRFVLSTGDNIYGKLSGGGSNDRDWEQKFFAPYAETLRAIPFKAVLGNHDGNESERHEDLAVCLDNFFLPERWYRFVYASFVEFLALDTTSNQPRGRRIPVYLAGGAQTNWLAERLAEPPLPWRLAAMHHPMFTAGPRHKPYIERLRHWLLAMRSAGVQAVFSGHEHNLQISERDDATGNMQFIVSGAGGELRSSSIRKRMKERHIRAWSSQIHFLSVTINGDEMTVEPVGLEPIGLRGPDGKPATQPIRIVSKR